MKNRLLISVAAAALIAGTGFANAQGAGGNMNQGGSSATQHSAPSGGGSATQHREDSGMKSGQSERMGGKEAQDTKSQGREKDKSGTVGQAAPEKGSKDMKAQGREDMKAQGREDMKAQGREQGREKEKSGTVGQAPEKSGATTKGHEDKSGTTTQGREDRMNTQGQKGATENNRMENRTQTQQGTTGNAATSARVAAPPPEKRTQIVSAIRSERIEDVTNVNVNVAVGTRLPASVHFVPLPPRIVEIYPEWRGYEVVRIHGRYVIVEPDTREIVYVIEG
jgi:hypothetical protein